MATENDMLARLEQLMSKKFDAFEQKVLHSQKQLTQEELSKIKQGLNSGDSYSFRKKGNEEQHKLNFQVLDKLKEARGHLNDALESGSCDPVVTASEKLAEGMNILSHRQKLIKLADSSDSGWRVVQEYEAHPLADDSDDEKKIYRAQVKAN